MERRWQRVRLEYRLPAAGLDKGHPIEPADVAFNSDSAIKGNQVGAAAKQNVLTVIDDFAGAGMLVGRCTSAEVRTALEEGHSETRG